MAGATGLVAGVEGILAGLGWLVRRGSSFFVSLMFALKKVPPVRDKPLLASLASSCRTYQKAVLVVAPYPTTVSVKYCIDRCAWTIYGFCRKKPNVCEDKR